MRPLSEFGNGENSIDHFLSIDNSTETSEDLESPYAKESSMRIPRQVLKAHYTRVYPEAPRRPYYIHASKSCAEMLALAFPNPNSPESDHFARVFAGSELVQGLDKPYCMNYGCHCYGQWFGQLGDGRAITLGEVYTGKRLSCKHGEAIDAN
jgi:uncharacterized protein YdiU (UPF0061 family)